MPTFVWTDEVPVGSLDFFTPGKRYPVVAGNGHLATVIDDGGDPTILYLPGCPLLDGRAWNVETVADPAPPADPSADLLAARVTVADRSMTVAELIAAHEREQWQPIETAPNGETILVAYEDGDVDLVEADDNHYVWYPYKAPIAGTVQSTHWRPLPAPPAPTETEGA